MSNKKTLLDQEKNLKANFGSVFRSSAIFFLPKKILTTISVSNYWEFKNNKKIGLLFSIRNIKGKLISREEKYFNNENVLNFEFKGKFNGSIEIEVFGNSNLRIPYAAIMAIYETKKSVSMVHSYARNHSLQEIEDSNCIIKAKESCWTIKTNYENLAVFHNGHIPVKKQKAKLVLTKLDGKEKSYNFTIPNLKKYETYIFRINKIAKDFKSFFKNQNGFGSIYFNNNSSFTRLLLIWKDNSNFQVTHSNFDYSSIDTNDIRSKIGGEMIIPNLKDVEAEFIVYPKFQKGKYNYLYDDEKENFKNGFIKKIKKKTSRVIFKKIDSKTIPSRIVTGISGRFKNQKIPFECSTGILHEKIPPKRFSWAIVSPKHKSLIYLNLSNVLKTNKNDRMIIIQLYSSNTKKVLKKKLRIPKDVKNSRIELEKIFLNYESFLNNQFGYISVFSENTSLRIFTSISNNNSLTLEHGF